MLRSRNQLKLFIFPTLLQYELQMPIALLRADNNLPPWRPGLKEVNYWFCFSCMYELQSFLFSCNACLLCGVNLLLKDKILRFFIVA